MAGKYLLICLSALTLTSALAQEPATTDPKEEKKNRQWWATKKDKDATPSPEFDNVRKAIDALSPEQKKRFQENFWRWTNLSPEEKKSLRDREEVRKKVVQQEIEAALQESGLQLQGQRRNQFAKRYAEERRKIEEGLRKDMNEKRKPLVHELVARLKAEFTESNSTASATPAAPAATPAAQ